MRDSYSMMKDSYSVGIPSYQSMELYQAKDNSPGYSSHSESEGNGVISVSVSHILP